MTLNKRQEAIIKYLKARGGRAFLDDLPGLVMSGKLVQAGINDVNQLIARGLVKQTGLSRGFGGAFGKEYLVPLIQLLKER